MNILTESTYVDDVIFGADTEEEAYELYRSSKELMSHGQFNLQKFVMNIQSLQSHINAQENVPMRPSNADLPTVEASEETYAETTFPSSHYNEQKVLGVLWNLTQDQLIFTLESFVENAVHSHPTKRQVVSLVGQIYGFLSPVAIRLKILMQELCKIKIGWDQQLEGAVLTHWKKLLREMSPSPPLVLPRCYFELDRANADYRLYGFCDASTSAYAAVVYLVKEFDGQNSSSFVTAKTRVAPLKTVYPKIGAAISSFVGQIDNHCYRESLFKN